MAEELNQKEYELYKQQKYHEAIEQYSVVNLLMSCYTRKYHGQLAMLNAANIQAIIRIVTQTNHS